MCLTTLHVLGENKQFTLWPAMQKQHWYIIRFKYLHVHVNRSLHSLH